MANSPILYPNSDVSRQGVPSAPSSGYRKRNVEDMPVLMGTRDKRGVLVERSVLKAAHPLARAKSPLASSGIPGGRWIQVAYVIADIVLVLFNFVLVFKLRWLSTYGIGSGVDLPPHYLSFVLLDGPIVALFCHTQGLYRTTRNRSRSDEGFAVAKAVCLATVLLTASMYASGVHTISRLIVLGSAVLNIVTLSMWRRWKRGVVEQRMAAGIGVKNVLIVGAGKVGREIANYLDENKQLGLVVKGFVDQNHETDPRVLGKIEDLCIVARAEFVDEIIITIPSKRQLVKRVILEAKRNNLDIKIIPQLYGAHRRTAKLEYAGEVPVIALYREPVPAIGSLVKRLLDVVGALVGLTVLSPLFVATAVLVKCDSAGPVFYRSQRIGKKGKRFVCYKFRTMVADAESLKESLRHLNEREGAIFKIASDPRITRVGTILRKYSLDELPQLLNVLTGEMSLVGPRPHPVDDYKQYGLEHLRRLDVTPGITGLWQVTARRDPSFEKNVALDLEYIENWSLWIDLRILFKTVSAVVLGEGA